MLYKQKTYISLSEVYIYNCLTFIDKGKGYEYEKKDLDYVTSLN